MREYWRTKEAIQCFVPKNSTQTSCLLPSIHYLQDTHCQHNSVSLIVFQNYLCWNDKKQYWCIIKQWNELHTMPPCIFDGIFLYNPMNIKLRSEWLLWQISQNSSIKCNAYCKINKKICCFQKANESQVTDFMRIWHFAGSCGWL